MVIIFQLAWLTRHKCSNSLGHNLQKNDFHQQVIQTNDLQLIYTY